MMDLGNKEENHLGIHYIRSWLLGLATMISGKIRDIL